MDFILSRYRNLSVLLLVVFGQLLLLAYQVRSNTQVRVLRDGAVSAIAPTAKMLETGRSSVKAFFHDYFILLDVREENRQMKAENNRLKLENNFLKTEIGTADRAKALIEFKGRSPSKTLAARIIAASTSSKTVVFVDRGTSDGVFKGMAVITGDGIVGKVLDSFLLASQVQLISDPLFGAGVVSQKNRVYGTLEGQGHNRCKVNRVQNEEKVEVGEMFYTTGEDRVFPKGLPVGKVVSVQPGPTFKLIDVVPAGTANGLTEEVLIVLEGVHQDVPPPNAVAEKIQLSPAPPLTKDSSINSMPISGGANGQMVTDADKTVEKYRALEQSRGATFGAYGSQAPSFSSIPSLPVRQPQGLLPQEPKADATAADSPPASSIPPIPPKKQ